MNKPADSNKTLVKAIAIWGLFLIAVMRIVELFLQTGYLFYIIIPSVLIFAFLLYYLLKTNTYLKFWRFLAAISALSFLNSMVYLIVLVGLRNNYEFEVMQLITVLVATGVLIPLVLYGLTYFIKRAVRR